MGDAHRILRSKDKKYSDPCFERLLSCVPNTLSHNLSSFYTRPAYSHTHAAVGGIRDGVSNV